MNRTKLVCLIFVLGLLVTFPIGNQSLVVELARAADSDGSTGSFDLDAIPELADVDFVDASYVTTSTLTPDDSTIFGLNFTVTFPATMAYLDNITLWIYDDSQHPTDPAGGTPDGLQLIKVTWVEQTDVWSISQGSLTQWTEQSSIDPGVDASDTEFEFCFRFDISKVARADTDWNATVAVYDNDSISDWTSASETSFVTMNNYFEASFSTSTFSWGQVDSGATNETHDPLTFDVIANTQWELTILGTDFTASGESPVDLDITDCICWDLDGSAGGVSLWIRNTETICEGTWDNQAALSTETPIQLSVYILLSTSTFFDSGAGKTWSTDITIQIQANT